MTFTDVGWVALLVVGTIALFLWGKRGKRYGHKALAARAQILLQDNKSELYLLYSSQSVGLQLPPNRRSWWDFIATGYLAYFENNKLIIEVPWWNKMKIFRSYAPQEVKIKRTRVFSNSNDALLMAGQDFLVAGINITDSKSVREALEIDSSNGLEPYLTQFIKALSRLGFEID